LIAQLAEPCPRTLSFSLSSFYVIFDPSFSLCFEMGKFAMAHSSFAFFRPYLWVRARPFPAGSFSCWFSFWFFFKTTRPLNRWDYSPNVVASRDCCPLPSGFFTLFDRPFPAFAPGVFGARWMPRSQNSEQECVLVRGYWSYSVCGSLSFRVSSMTSRHFYSLSLSCLSYVCFIGGQNFPGHG